MDYSLLRLLLPYLEDYQHQQTATPSAPTADTTQLAGFATWLHQQLTPQQHLDAVARQDRRPGETYESQIAMYNTFLYRYARNYSRLALEDTPLVSFDDFTYLATVYGRGPLSKTELIQRNIHEKPAGTEVIKRLLKNELVQEENSPTDRRSKLLTITDSGKKLLFVLLARMSQVAEMAAGNLSPDERHQLVALLLKLDSFHNPIFLAPRANTLAELQARFFPNVPPPFWPAPEEGVQLTSEE
jgi:DNA-binding MarR family transcriptional regulator